MNTTMQILPALELVCDESPKCISQQQTNPVLSLAHTPFLQKLLETAQEAVRTDDGKTIGTLSKCLTNVVGLDVNFSDYLNGQS